MGPSTRAESKVSPGIPTLLDGVRRLARSLSQLRQQVVGSTGWRSEYRRRRAVGDTLGTSPGPTLPRPKNPLGVATTRVTNHKGSTVVPDPFWDSLLSPGFLTRPRP